MTKSSQPFALIFDMDGVLIDNTLAQAKAFDLLFRELKLETKALPLLKRLNGMPATNILKSIFRHPVPAKQLKQYAENREFLYRTLYWDKRKELKGLTTFLAASRDAGFKIGLGTGSPPETISYIIDHLHLRHFFDAVVGKADVDKGKPHADTYTTTAQQLGIPPEQCVVFEDALLGEQAAYKAGMRCIGVTTSLQASDFQAPLATIRDFTELTPAKLLKLLEQNPVAPKPSRKLAQRQYMKLK